MAEFFVSAFVIIRDRKGRILLVRKKGEAKWSLPGGGVEEGEAPWQGAIRESQEETGYKVKILKMLGMYYIPAINKIKITFRAKVIGGKLRKDPGEISDCQFVKPRLRNLERRYKEIIQDAISGKTHVLKILTSPQTSG